MDSARRQFYKVMELIGSEIEKKHDYKNLKRIEKDSPKSPYASTMIGAVADYW